MSDAPHEHHHHERPSWQWRALGAWIVATFVLGTVGFWKYEVSHTGHGHLNDALYHATQLFILHAPVLEPPTNAYFEAARWMAVGLLWLAALSTVRRVFAGETREFTIGRRGNHAIICGEGRMVLDMVRAHRVLRPKQSIVVIADEGDAELIHTAEAAGAIVRIGRPVDVLRQAGILRAERLIAVFDDDRANVNVIEAARSLVPLRPYPGPVLQCFAQIKDFDLRDTLRKHLAPGTHDRCDVHFFDSFSDAARTVLLERLPLDHDGITKDDTRQVHLIVVGFGTMGRTVLVKAAQLGHFANGKPLRISVIDQDASAREQALLYSYPDIREMCDIEFTQCLIQSVEARTLIETWCKDALCVTSVVVCLDDDITALTLATRLLPIASDAGARVALRMSRQDGLTALLDDPATATAAHHKIHTFGWCDEAGFRRLLETDDRDTMAALVHGEFVKLAKDHGRKKAHDDALHSWRQLKEEDYRESSRQQVDHLAIKMRAAGCEALPLDNARPEVEWNADAIDFGILAEMEHRRWCAERRFAGWTFAEGTKNTLKRTNPNLVAWDQLTPKVKGYDFVAVSIVPDLLREVKAMKVCRRV